MDSEFDYVFHVKYPAELRHNAEFHWRMVILAKAVAEECKELVDDLTKQPVKPE